MFCSFLHHPGLAKTNYKTLFHMCRNEQISFDMESRSGSTFCLYDVLQSAVLGMLTIGVHRKAAVAFMSSAIEFIHTQVRYFVFIVYRLEIYPLKSKAMLVAKIKFHS